MPVALSIGSQIHNYEAIFEETADFLLSLAALPNAFFVVDENVWNIYAETLLQQLPVGSTVVLPIHEDRKNLETVQTLVDRLIDQPAKRNLTLVSIGGGIVQDITGFAASILYRGISWIFVPTTLLSQADSCIGSKTSLNYRGYKNLIGTFYPPRRIHIYVPFLHTQRKSDFFSGFGEVIKLHLLGGSSLYHQLIKLVPSIVQQESLALRTAVQQSLNIKLSYLAGDEFDTGRRNLLNFGHDFGHALESTSDFDVPHGQAVIVGLLAANIVSKNRGVLYRSLEHEIAENLLLPSLVVKLSSVAMDAERIIDAMKKDKKRTGDKLAIILMQSDFTFERINDLTFEEAKLAIEETKTYLGLK